jgi:hypothetical protein
MDMRELAREESEEAQRAHCKMHGGCDCPDTIPGDQPSGVCEVGKGTHLMKCLSVEYDQQERVTVCEACKNFRNVIDIMKP